jgi:hypothetical protein
MEDLMRKTIAALVATVVCIVTACTSIAPPAPAGAGPKRLAAPPAAAATAPPNSQGTDLGRAHPPAQPPATEAESAELANALAVLRNAIDMYQEEHDGQRPRQGAFVDVMLKYASPDGRTSMTKDSDFFLGPYLRRVPPLPVGGPTERGKNTVGKPDEAVAGSGIAWIYDASDGSIRPNTGTLVDHRRNRYTEY